MKTYIGLIRDHSGSMQHLGLVDAAKNDYNNQLLEIQENARNGHDNIITVIKCGVGRRAEIVREVVNSSALSQKPIDEYIADGHFTPLFDSVGEAIDILSSLPDADDPEVGFLILAITDGGENSSKKWRYTLKSKIRELHLTDRWTFVFRVPKTYGTELKHELGLYDGNILEWDTTRKGLEQATEHTNIGLQTFFKNRESGQTSTKTFFANLGKVDINEVKQSLEDVTTKLLSFHVEESDHGAAIREYVEDKIGNKMLKGAAFYQLSKSEEVQDYKKIIIQDKNTQKYYSSVQARELLQIPHTGTIRLRPGDHGQYFIFIQSTSINRKLVKGTKVIYWPEIGKAYTEGPSAL
jgi:hypothetical protein